MTTLYEIDELRATIQEFSETIDQLNATIARQAATIKRQRIAIETLLKAIQKYFDTARSLEPDMLSADTSGLEEVYQAVSSASTMTGTEER